MMFDDDDDGVVLCVCAGGRSGFLHVCRRRVVVVSLSFCFVLFRFASSEVGAWPGLFVCLFFVGDEDKMSPGGVGPGWDVDDR